MNVKKMAVEDAARWGYAQMFFGEGAGTKRKLLNAEISDKVASIPDYQKHFEAAYNKLNMGAIALKAAKDRKRIDRGNAVRKNTRAIIRGDRRSMSTLLIIGGAAYWYARETGYDKVIAEDVNKRYRRLKGKYAAWKLRRDLNDGDGI